MKIPFNNLKKHISPIQEEIMLAIERVVASGTYILGQEVEAFEQEWADFCNVKKAVAVGNGTDALALALKATGAIREGRGDEVITTTLSAGYTALAIKLAGGVPVFADIKPDSFTIDPQSIESLITHRTRAILPVHLYGQMADMDEIYYLASKHNLLIIEDAAQAHGARLDSKLAGTFGIASAFSFYPTKNLGGLGDGGIIISDNPSVIKKIKILRQGGHLTGLKLCEPGLNSRLDEIQAAVLRIKLKHLSNWNKKRQSIADYYNNAIIPTPSIELPFVKNTESHVYHLYVIKCRNRDKLRRYLKSKGIETKIHYPYLLHQQPLFQSYKCNSLTVAQTIVKKILSIPNYVGIGEDELSYISCAINNYIEEDNN